MVFLIVVKDMTENVGIVSAFPGHHKIFAGEAGRKFVRMLIKLRLKFYQVECGRFANQGARFTAGRKTKVKDYFNHTVNFRAIISYQPIMA
ncbi:hypothetical protein [Tatumella sp. JGM118]|uniref:hypothetical protein n=1 Tax=Tatumella sp. JGM118 TaxID=2799796 RepID=UPI001BAE7E43|nr:hypothetical protein [Tatumella sp. JGM118]MBS0908727.1 hypothetical protein [Tatumella sp. JGM118]